MPIMIFNPVSNFGDQSLCMYYESSLLTSGSNCQKHIVDTPRKRMDQVFLGHTIAVIICYLMYAL
jgi:hypothetical protein